MYLHKLEKDEKTAFLSLAIHLAQVDDNQIDQKEQYTIQYMAAEMGLDMEDFSPRAYDAEQFAVVFHRDMARRVVLMESLGICRCNGGVAPAQRVVLDDLATRFSAREDYLADAEGIIDRQMAIMDEFDSLIDGD